MPFRFERDIWQSTVTFETMESPSPTDVVRLLSSLETTFSKPLQMQWQIPALTGGPFGSTRFEVKADGSMQPLPPDLVVGTSLFGWTFQLSSRQLVVRHQQSVINQQRGVDRDAFPGVNAFAETVLGCIAALPPVMIAASRRTSLLVSYAAHSSDIYPASWIGSSLRLGHHVPYPPPDSERMVVNHQEQEFETLNGRRCVWNDVLRVGNWFGQKGDLDAGTAVIRTVELRTVLGEDAGPSEQRTTLLGDVPPLSVSDVTAFFVEPIGIGCLVDRIRHWLPEGAEIDE